MRKTFKSFAFLILFLFVASIVSAQESYIVPPAKNLANRISVGYNKQLNFGLIGASNDNTDLGTTFFNIDSLSSKYWATDRIGLEFMLGYFTAKNEEVGGWAIDMGGKFIYNLIMEDYMSFYTGAGFGVIPVHIDWGNEEDNEIGFEAMVFGGIEFFFEELPNLGFDVEMGMRYIDMAEYAQLSTFGGGFGLFGIRYYF